MSRGSSSRSTGKRPLQEDDNNSTNNPPAKRLRFPKGKKGKPVDVIGEKVIIVEENVNDLSNPVVAAKERMKRRNQIAPELLSEEISNNISAAEVKYKANKNFVEDGIHIEPFNLDIEREEGYFDASGNFIEYLRDNEIKDAWLDSVEIDPRYAGLSSASIKDDEEVQELSSKDVEIMKRRIANVLESEETILQCLRRLKGNGNKKAKMSGETKIVFDQLTEDAMKLMENGEYDVYHEKKHVFEQEAERYEE
ncbi:CD2 antigen cytoplasmic tail-binding protein [Trifolium repens]|nr:CD2 antigen cytoplasmic tail-binding protein [Trifolium repens]